MNTAVPERAKFHHMKDGTLEDWTIIGAEVQEFSKTLYQRIIDHLFASRATAVVFQLIDSPIVCKQLRWLIKMVKMKNMSFVRCSMT